MRERRFIIDSLVAKMITVGGVSVIVFILLIFLYLFRQVIPLFAGAEVRFELQQNLPATPDLLYLASNDNKDSLVQLDSRGRLTFYNLQRAVRLAEHQVLPLNGAALTAASKDAPGRGLLGVGTTTGEILLLGYEFGDDFTSGQRVTTAELTYPLGRNFIRMSNSPLAAISTLTDERSSTLVAYDSQGQLHGKLITTRVNSITRAVVLSETELQLPQLDFAPQFLQVFDAQDHILAVSSSGEMAVLGIERDATVALKQRISLGQEVLAVQLLLGANSILISTAAGEITQWFMVRARSALEEEVFRPFPGTIISSEPHQSLLQQIRSFTLTSPAVELAPVLNSKSFLALTTDGRLLFINAPSGKESFELKVATSAAEVALFAIAPRANGLLVAANDGEYVTYELENPHAEVSLKRLFGRVWYEGYAAPDFVWQSTSGSNEFESKLSVVPLTFGTLKAAFYAMLFSTPLAIAGALYTAFFMSSSLRRKIKPVIEMMEAFPTVILGFIAGIIIAPYFERNLPGVLSIFLVLPPTIIISGFLLRWLSLRLKFLPTSLETLLLLPFIVLVAWGALQLSPLLESQLFGGDTRAWLNRQGIDYNQRNALVIGIAMGLAVIPTIYSIAEDACYAVPRLMINGAYALGATQLQNALTIAIPAALSGILSAIMIGFGRAVGETMIVLMATGNTPVMNASIFTGMRTLAANIAVELPEAAAGSTHFRVLFLCGLLLLLFTFAVNIIAEVVRQRIRRKYANI